TAKIWRTPVLGELFQGTVNPTTLRLVSRESNATPGPMPAEWQRSVLDHFDHGTQRAILRLYRASPPDLLARAGEALGKLDAPSPSRTSSPRPPARTSQPPPIAANSSRVPASHCGTTRGTAATTCSPTRCSPPRSPPRSARSCSPRSP